MLDLVVRINNFLQVESNLTSLVASSQRRELSWLLSDIESLQRAGSEVKAWQAGHSTIDEESGSSRARCAWVEASTSTSFPSAPKRMPRVGGSESSKLFGTRGGEDCYSLGRRTAAFQRRDH